MTILTDVQDLETLVTRCVRDAVPDAERVEIDAFLSGLRSSIGLRAINLAFEAKRAGQPRSICAFSGLHVFDLTEVPRNQFVNQLVHTSGFDAHECLLILTTMEKLLEDQLRQNESVEIDGLGVIGREGHMIKLALSEELRVCLPGEKFTN